jgi:hypothetical protein
MVPGSFYEVLTRHSTHTDDCITGIALLNKLIHPNSDSRGCVDGVNNTVGKFQKWGRMHPCIVSLVTHCQYLIWEIVCVYSGLSLLIPTFNLRPLQIVSPTRRYRISLFIFFLWVRLSHTALPNSTGQS